MPIDDRTSNRSYKLPNPANLLSDDVQRLRDALSQVDADINGILSGAPSALNTLAELAAAIGNDPAFATTIATALGLKANTADVYSKTASDARYVQGTTQVENLFTGNGSTTTFTLTQSAPNRESVLLSVGGVVQPIANYTVSGTTLTLVEAPGNGVKVRALLLGVAGPSLSASTLNYTGVGAGALTRSVEARLREIPSLNDYPSLTSALASQDSIELPPGIFLLSSEFQVPRDGIRIKGAGMGRTILRCAPGMTTGHAIVLAGRSDCHFEDFTLDCNATARGLTVTSGLNGFNVQGNRNRWDRVEVMNAPRNGILIDGNTIASSENHVEGCHLLANGGVGVSINKASHNKIIRNRFRQQGWENLTLDVQCFGNMAIGNHFFEAQLNGGGCGNIGWDDSDGSVFMGNIIDSGRPSVFPDLYQVNGNIIGLCINSEAGVTTGAVISSNVIVNCRDYGIYLRNRTGQANPGGIPNWNPSKPGDAIIVGNYIRSNGYCDIRIADTDQVINLGTNNYTNIIVDDPDTQNVRLPAGDSAAELEMASNQAVPVQQFTRVLFSTARAARRIGNGSGIVSLTCGGFYAIDAKVRFDVGASGVNTVQMRIVTPSGQRVYNETLAAGQTVGEITLSVTKLLAKGDVYVEVYPFGGSGTINLLSGSENWLSVTSLG